MRPVVATSVLVFLALLASSCGGGGPSVGDGGDPTGAWELTAGTADGDELAIPADRRITLVVEGDRWGGTSACNSYGGRWTGDGLVDLAVTEMGCMPRSVMEAEAAYLGALQRVTAWDRDGDGLALTGDGVELRYAPVPPVPTAEVVGTRWELTTIIRGETASTTLGDPGTLLLAEDGTFAASTGCRRLVGRWEAVGDEIVLPELAAEGECTPDLEEQDALVLDVLGDGFRPEVDGRQLTIMSDGGDGLVYDAG